jgi:hypothetical protein
MMVILGFGRLPEVAPGEDAKAVAASVVIQRVRDLLGVGVLLALRQQALEEGLRTIEEGRSHAVDPNPPSETR